MGAIKKIFGIIFLILGIGSLIPIFLPLFNIISCAVAIFFFFLAYICLKGDKDTVEYMYGGKRRRKKRKK